MTSVIKMDRRQVEAVFDLLPNSHYNPVFVVGDADEVVEMLSHRSGNYLDLCAADMDIAPTMNDSWYIIRDFEGIETEPVLQEKVADFLGDCILQKQQIVIISKRGIHSMKLDGRLRSRICSGVIIA